MEKDEVALVFREGSRFDYLFTLRFVFFSYLVFFVVFFFFFCYLVCTTLKCMPQNIYGHSILVL